MRLTGSVMRCEAHLTMSDMGRRREADTPRETHSDQG